MVMNTSNQRPDIVFEGPLIIKLPQVHINFQQCLPHLIIDADDDSPDVYDHDDDVDVDDDVDDDH